ncbi:MAG: hypothetical protein ABFD92_05795 [Planctomycetaceae bacterium]|nr:hypothetical protein [Planctomycetaceae bacterium]
MSEQTQVPPPLDPRRSGAGWKITAIVLIVLLAVAIGVGAIALTAGGLIRPAKPQASALLADVPSPASAEQEIALNVWPAVLNDMRMKGRTIAGKKPGEGLSFSDYVSVKPIGFSENRIVGVGVHNCSTDLEAAELANALSEAFVAQRRSVAQAQLKEAVQDLTRQKTVVEYELGDIRRKMGMIQSAAAGIEILTSQRAHFMDEQLTVDFQLQAVNARLKEMEEKQSKGGGAAWMAARHPASRDAVLQKLQTLAAETRILEESGQAAAAATTQPSRHITAVSSQIERRYEALFMQELVETRSERDRLVGQRSVASSKIQVCISNMELCLRAVLELEELKRQRDCKYAMIEMLDRRVMDMTAINAGPWILSPASVRAAAE